MNLFVNEYKYTDEILCESTKTWWRRKFKKGFFEMGFCMLLILIIVLVRKQYLFFTMELLPLAIMILLKFREINAVKVEKERMHVMYKDTVPTIHIEIGDDIHFTSDKNDRTISFLDIEDMAETKNLIVLFIKGSMTLALDKKGFTTGTAEECLHYLKEK